MDIQRNAGPDHSKKAFEQRQRSLIDSNRALVRAARSDLRAAAAQRSARMQAAEQNSEVNEAKAAPRDEIHISEAAQRANEPSSAEREARVQELAEEHRMERLHSPERLERAAERLLGG